MPCRDEGASQAAAAEFERDAKAKIDKLTRMLCHAMTWATQFMNPANGRPSVCLFGEGVGVELQQWWGEHQRADAARKEREEREKRQADQRRRERIAELEAELARLREQH